ncbi:MAG: M18 family aminopeptidase [Thermoplasmata archaeon]
MPDCGQSDSVLSGNSGDSKLEEPAKKMLENEETLQERIEQKIEDQQIDVHIVDLMKFIESSPSPFHVVSRAVSRLKEAGYIRLEAGERWKIENGGKYFVETGGSALIAFQIGTAPLPEAGFRIIAAHTDSPTFRIKPNPEIMCENYIKLNTEVYGSPILCTWFDRPLSLAGRVCISGDSAAGSADKVFFAKHLVDFGRPLLLIPNLAIHMNRNVNDGVKISKQKDAIPVLALLSEKEDKKKEKKEENKNSKSFLAQLIASELKVLPEHILDYDLFLYPLEPPCLVGPSKEFISSSRLDNLAMVHAALTALCGAGLPETPNNHGKSGAIKSGNEQEKKEALSTPAPQAAPFSKVVIFFDNEEIGSRTKAGADSPFFAAVFERICLSLGFGREDYFRSISRSFLISADMAHAVHPNSQDKYDPVNRVRLNGGPVIKLSASGSYMTDSESASVFESLCRKARVPCQRFTNNSDEPGGSTIGLIFTTQMPVMAVDAGSPMLAMHSCRETAGTLDHRMMIKVFKEFFSG